MWHEARRREKATQKIFSDHKKRAEKRREENKVDPSTLLQVHGVKSKINLDPSTHKLAAKSLVVWQGDKKTTIDRFDVRATLSSLPSDDRSSRNANQSRAGEDKRHVSTILDADESELTKKLLIYERYRLLIQNDLNKIPEERRLKLVAKSESLSEAKLRKLERNYFGTSGETSLTGESSNIGHRNYNNNLNRGNRHQQQAARSQGVAVGYNYNQASPVSHVSHDEVDSKLGLNQTNLATSIIDLDDYGDLDLDCVDKREKGSKKTFDVISKYGLDCDELNLLIDLADDKTTCLSSKEILRKLQQLKNKDKDKAPRDVAHQAEEVSEFYGPILPPDMEQDSKRPDPAHDDSASDDSPVRQRSPSGAAIPMRDRTSDKSGSDSPISITGGDQQDQISIRNRATPKCDPETYSNRVVQKTVNSTNGDHKVVTKGEEPRMTVKRDMNPASPGESRRASTPLAYKRYRRSSRSLSRERQPTRRHRSSSNSSTSDDSSSSTSYTSDSSSSASTSSRTTYSSSSPASSRSRRSSRARHRSQTKAHGRHSKSPASRRARHHVRRRR